MNNQANKSQVTSIYYDAPRAINIGDVFYMVVPVESCVFREGCKVCGDKRNLTINNVTFRCPCCDSSSAAIKINNYVVRRYRVNGIYDVVSDYDWKASTSHCITFKLYHKAGRERYSWSSNHERIELHANDFNNLNASAINKTNPIRNVPYDDYNLAVATAAELRAAELARLKEYNDNNGTSHIAEFKLTDDKKST